MKKIFFQAGAFLLGLGIFGGLVYFSMAPGLDAIKKSREILVEIQWSGGLCPDGSICKKTETISVNGKYSGGENLTPQEVSLLKKHIDSSSLNMLVKHPQPSCASFADGQDVAYVFPTKYDTQVFTPCLLLNSEQEPLFKYLAQIL